MNRYIEYGLSKYIYYKYANNKNNNTINDKWVLLICRHPLGDTVIESSFIKNIKENFKNNKIMIVCSKSNFNLLEKCPYIDELIVYDSDCKKSFYKTNFERIKIFANKYYQNKIFDLGIVPSTCMPSLIEAWLIYFSGAKRRVTYSEKMNINSHHEYMGSYDMYFTDVLQGEVQQHEVLQNAHIIEMLTSKSNYAINTDYEIWTTDEDNKNARKYLLNLSNDSTNIIVNLTTSQNSKNWPLERYIEVCNRIKAKYDVCYILIGAGQIARDYANEFCNKVDNKYYDVVNKTTIRQTAEVMKQADVYLGGDTGPLHMAVACGLTGVAIYKTPENTELWLANSSKRLYPWSDKFKMLNPKLAIEGCENTGCDKKEAHCIKQITVEQVYDALCNSIEDIKKIKSKKYSITR